MKLEINYHSLFTPLGRQSNLISPQMLSEHIFSPRVITSFRINNFHDIGTKRYLENVRKLTKDNSDEDEIDYIIEFFKQNKIKCVKYKYNIHSTTQSQQCFDSFIQLCPQGKRLIISEKRVNKEIYRYKALNKEDNKKTGIFQNFVNKAQAIIERPAAQKKEHKCRKCGIENDSDLEMDTQGPETKYSIDVSIKSPLLSEVTSISFGGYSSRFMMLRKHVNTTSSFEIENIPFKSW